MSFGRVRKQTSLYDNDSNKLCVVYVVDQNLAWTYYIYLS